MEVQEAEIARRALRLVRKEPLMYSALYADVAALA